MSLRYLRNGKPGNCVECLRCAQAEKSKDTQWRAERREYMRKYARERYRGTFSSDVRQRGRVPDTQYRTVRKLRSRLAGAFKAQAIRKSKSSELYGIDWVAIVEHLGPQPSPDHTIDHIRPCSSFDHSDPDQVKECWSPENLRWLHKDLNYIKNDRPEEEFQDLLTCNAALASLL